jgi:hypothetical protein
MRQALCVPSLSVAEQHALKRLRSVLQQAEKRLAQQEE